MDPVEFRSDAQSRKCKIAVNKTKKNKKSIFSRLKNVFISDKKLKKQRVEFETGKVSSYYNQPTNNLKCRQRESTSSLNEDTEDEHNEEETIHAFENSHEELHLNIMNDPESMKISQLFCSSSSSMKEENEDRSNADYATKYLEHNVETKMNIEQSEEVKYSRKMIMEESNERDVTIEEREQEGKIETVVKQKNEIKNFDFTADDRPIVLGYIAGDILGTGMSGKVKLGQHIHDPKKKAALKIISTDKKSPLMLRLLETELRVMKRINSHPNILKLIDCAKNVPYQETPTSQIDNSICMALEVATNGELFDYILHSNVFEETLARTYAYQLTSAISYCHDHGIIHRDIKPENLLLDSNFQLKVADFGLSSDKDKFEEFLSTECGTKAYMAPEILSKNKYIGEKSDCWSIGVVLFIMLSGNPPFQIADTSDWWFKQLALNRPERFWKAHLSYYAKFPREAMSILGRIFQPNPKYRYTVKQIVQDNWMTSKKLDKDELFKQMEGRKLKVQEAKLNEKKKALASKEASQNAAATFCKAAGVTNNIADPFQAKVCRTIQPEASNDSIDRENILPPIYKKTEIEHFTNSSFYQIYTGSDGFTVIDKVLSLIMTHRFFQPISMLQKKDAFSYLIKGANEEFTLNVYRERVENIEAASEPNYLTMVELRLVRGDRISFGRKFNLIHQALSLARVRFNSDIVVIQDETNSENQESLANSNDVILNEKIDMF